MDKVRLGVIGLGGMGQGHLKSIKDVQEAQLTAVSDVDAEITKKIFSRRRPGRHSSLFPS